MEADLLKHNEITEQEKRVKWFKQDWFKTVLGTGVLLGAGLALNDVVIFHVLQGTLHDKQEQIMQLLQHAQTGILGAVKDQVKNIHLHGIITLPGQFGSPPIKVPIDIHG